MSAISGKLPWRLDDIDLDAIDTERVRNDEPLLLLLAASSFVEAASAVYSRNLLEHFAGDENISVWLAGRWEHEELQHGRALRAYIAKAWPGFRWERAYRAFFPDYTGRCTREELEPLCGLELVARCVVETGTATLYRSIHNYACDPVLRTITANISSDEVHHYRQFFQYFARYQITEQHSRYQILGALLRRAAELRASDMSCGLRHAFAEWYGVAARPSPPFQEMKARVAALVRQHFPFELAAKMAVKPLAFPAAVRTIACYPVMFGVRWLMLR